VTEAPDGEGAPAEVDTDHLDERDVDEAYTGPDVGNPRIGQAVARLQRLGDSPPEEHIEVYEELHQVLHETLSDAQQPPSDGTGHGAGSGSTGGAQP
jgi:hypothetical protein